MNRLLKFTVLSGILLHGYFYIAYETVHPCRAAIVRAVEDKEPLFVAGAPAKYGKARSDEALRVAAKALANERGYYFCYKTAVIGTFESTPVKPANPQK